MRRQALAWVVVSLLSATGLGAALPVERRGVSLPSGAALLLPAQTSVEGEILARTELIVTVPSRVAALFARTGDFKVLPLPLRMPSFEVRLHWHQRFHQDPANRWLREVMAELYAEQA